ncbi:ATP-binding protein [Pseudomonas soli]|uniref:Uncharacterized protein n=1 Tax=Pseudomonas soli TaxID=1306993 RepID=A0A2V4I9V7_9PSED|nr:ATP-binding protein [Pseudomonas soli]PYB79860.1 hypothetical protein DMX07_15815 [Pseudomonas soli]
MKGKKKVRVTLRAIQASILNGYSVMHMLSAARAGLAVTEFGALLSWLQTATKKGRPVGDSFRQSLFPRDISELRSLPVMGAVSGEREIHWFTAIALSNIKKLNSQVEFFDTFEAAFLSDDPCLCTSLLESYEADFGFSLWLIDARIALLQHFDGMEAQKSYLATIKEKALGNVGWLAVSCSNRNEGSTTFFNYLNLTMDLLDSIEHDPLKHWLKYQSMGIIPDEPPAQQQILQYQSNSALIDAYIALFDILQQCVLDEAHPLHATGTKCVLSLVEKVHDPRLQRLLFLAGKITHPGQRISQLDDPHDQINNWPLMWKHQAERLIYCAAPAPQGRSFIDTSIASLCDVYTQGADADVALASALKQCLNFRWMSASQVFTQLLMREMSSSALSEPSDMTNRFVYTSYIDESIAQFLPGESKKNYLGIISEYKNLQSLVAEVESPYQSHHEALESSAQELFNQNFPRALEYATAAIKSPQVRIRRLAARLICACAIHEGNKSELIQQVSSFAVDDPQSIHLLPIGVCGDYLDKTLRKEMKGELSASVALSLNYRHYDDSYSNILSYAYEDFLISHGLERPSQLISHFQKFKKNLLVYYLRYICVPETMKVSSVFLGTLDLQDERLAVCSMLLELDPENQKIYESEIMEITRAQVVRSGVRHVEQSKMSIDTIALRRWADKKHRESFSRYKGMLKVGLRPSEGFEEAYFNLLTDGTPLPSEFLQVPTDEAGSLLQEILRSILLEATINPMYGLDCYLSMRIRHGALSGQLRGPLELQGIITRRQASDGAYVANEIWMERLSSLGSTERKRINIELCVFSARYDALIEHITNELIQIKSEEKPSGLFDMKIVILRIRMLASILKEDTSFEEFFNECINIFWGTVEHCLYAVHNVIDQRLKVEINAIFSTLQTTVDEAGASRELAELTQCIRTAHTNALQAIEQIKDWFRLPAPREEPLFEMEQLIDIGLQCVQRIHRNFTPTITKNLVELPLLANALTYFSDIFFILFDNARRYSNAGASPQITITINRKAKDTITFTFTNEVEKLPDDSSHIERIEEIQKKIDSGDYQQAIRSEGGTGLIKLKRIIGYSQPLEFGYTAGSQFTVVFDTNLREVELENFNS